MKLHVVLRRVLLHCLVALLRLRLLLVALLRPLSPLALLALLRLRPPLRLLLRRYPNRPCRRCR